MKRKNALPRRKFSLRSYFQKLAALSPVILTGSIGGIGAIHAALTWKGSVSNVWDINTTPNWVTTGTSTPVVYTDGTSPSGTTVTFDDTASQFNVSIFAPGDTKNNIPAGVTPSSITVNSTHDYTIGGDPIDDFGGTGTTLTKSGTGTLTLTGDNSFNGAISINNGTISVSDFYGNAGFGNLGSGVGTLTIGSTSAPAKLLYTGSAIQSVNNPVAISGQGGTIATDQLLTFTSPLSGSGTLTVDQAAVGGGGVNFGGTNTFTGSVKILNGTVTFQTLAPGAAGSKIFLPTSGSGVGDIEYSGSTDVGTTASPDQRVISVPQAGGTVLVDGAANSTTGVYPNWYVSNVTDVAGGQALTKDGPGGLIITGRVQLNNLPYIANGLLGFTNTSTSSPNVFPTGSIFFIQSGTTLLTHVNSLGNAGFQLQGGTLALVGGDQGSGTTNFNVSKPFNVLVTGDQSSGSSSSTISYTAGTFTTNVQAQVGQLTMPVNNTLNVTAGRFTFQTSNYTDSGAYTFNVSAGADISPGAITDNKNSINFVKVGDGNLSLDNANITGLTSPLGITVQQGNLQIVGNGTTGVDPLNGGTITFNNNNSGVAPGLVLASSSGNATFNNPITLTTGGTITAGPTAFGGAAAGALTMTLGNTGAPVLQVASGNSLTLKSTGSYTLNEARQIIGGGDVNIGGGTVALSASNNFINNFNVTAGTANITGANTTIANGTLSAGTTNFNIATAITSTFTVSSGAIANIAAPVTVSGLMNIYSSGTVNVTSSLTTSNSNGVSVQVGGKLTLTGANYSGGPISVNAGH